MDIALRKIAPHELELFRKEMKKSFEKGILDRFGDVSFAPIPPENEVDEAVRDILFFPLFFNFWTAFIYA